MVIDHWVCFDRVRGLHGLPLHAILSVFLGPGYCYGCRTFACVRTILTRVLTARFQAASGSVCTWFSRRRGFAVGVMMSGSGLGGVCYPVMFKRLFNQVGFGWSVRWMGFLMVGCLLVANLLVRSRVPPRGWTKGRSLFDYGVFKDPLLCLVAVYSSLGR